MKSVTLCLTLLFTLLNIKSVKSSNSLYNLNECWSKIKYGIDWYSINDLITY